MMKVYPWMSTPWYLPKLDKLLSAAEPQKQNLAASGMKDNASIVEIRAIWHVTAQKRNISIQSHTKPSKSIFLTNLSASIIRSSINQSMINQSPIIIEDSENQISNRLNSAITPRDTLLLSKKEMRMKDTKRVMNYPL